MTTDYEMLASQAGALMASESDTIANCANFAALVFHELKSINWAGFYFADDGGDLVLGPFQGRPACTRIAAGRGVCGTSFAQNATLVVDDVHAFADHIACDSASRSEIVIPLRDASGRPYGVFDIDSPQHARFTDADRAGIELVVAAFTASVSLPAQNRANAN